LSGGVSSIAAPLAPALLAPGALPTLVPLAPVPAARPSILRSAAGEVAAEAVPSALSAAKNLAAAIDEDRAKNEGPDAASKRFFDGAGEPSGDAAAIAAAANGVSPLGRLYPRVVIILDTLDHPAGKDDRIVKYIETLVDKGVKVVFVTARPEKGENSAESMLISQLKIRTGNPVLVVSYNGARITAHSSKAVNPKSLIPDQLPFAEAVIARFREITKTVNAKFNARGGAEFGKPSLEEPFIYGAELPAKADPSRWARADPSKWAAAFNRALKSAGFAYKVELSRNAAGKTIYFTQSTALRLNANRIFNALYAIAPELDPSQGGFSSLKPGQVLILADPAKAPSFLQALPQKGYFIHGVHNTASLEDAMAAVLDGAELDQVAVNKFELRDYIEWLSRRQRYGPSSGARRPGVFSKRKAGDTGKIPFYRGIIGKETMSRLFHQMKNGALSEATLDAALSLSEKLWRYPEANGINLPDELKYARQTPAFQAAQRGGLMGLQRWIKNYYHRHFPDYPRNVNEKVAGRLLRMARDGDSVTLYYSAPYTGRRYKVFVNPDRTELWEDSAGNVLVGHVYRTGKEPKQGDFNESVEVNLVARALLEGDAQKRPDGKWYVNGEPNPRVMVVFHYMTRDLQVVQTPDQVEAHTPEITALIEKRAADKEYKKWLDKKEKDEERARINLKSAATRAENLKKKAKIEKDRKEKGRRTR
ncbi:MAG: hypothetical protein HYZ74_06280, partial [Elusimicrobia bacterium]|nr:hypothetical protein [Elusimicrobiota bacterium]